MSQHTTPDDRVVEDKLRQILGPFDRCLDRGGSVLASALMLVVPATFLTLWLVVGLDGKRAVGWAAGAFGVVLVAGITWDWLVVYFACWRFDHCFPRGSVVRGSAVRILAELQTPSTTEEKLLRALASESAAHIVRHRPDAEIAVLPAAPVTAGSPPPAAAESDRRPGGYYDYIPLEPRTPEAEPGETGRPG